MELFKVADSNKMVTDGVLAAFLVGQGINRDGVELTHDYALRSGNHSCSPYRKVYTDLNSDKKFLVVSGLPMVDAYGQKHELEWRDKKGVIESGNNIFHSIVKGLDTRLVALSDQPGNIKKDGEVIFHPQLFVGGSEVLPLSLTPRLLEIDPVNENYHNNVLEWDYGICQRRVRLIEGRLLGSWVFPQNPHGPIRIKYNQAGAYRLKLGKFRVGDDEEIIPAAAFKNPVFGYPVIISDTATFYLDAHPESISVDGYTSRQGVSEDWSAIVAGAGNNADDSSTFLDVEIDSASTSNKWAILTRAILLFETSGLPDAAVVTNAVLSVYGWVKSNVAVSDIDINVYTSNPAGSTAIINGDYSNIGSAAKSTAITYANFNTGDPGTSNDFTINDLSVISLTGITKLGLRNANHDVANSAPTWGNSAAQAYLASWSADKGSGYKPKLVVTFTSADQKSSLDNGSVVEIVSARALEISDSGSGIEIGLAAAFILAGDGGSGSEIGGLQKSLIDTDSGRGIDAFAVVAHKAGSDFNLYGTRGEVGIPHKEVSL